MFYHDFIISRLSLAMWMVQAILRNPLTLKGSSHFWPTRSFNWHHSQWKFSCTFCWLWRKASTKSWRYYHVAEFVWCTLYMLFRRSWQVVGLLKGKLGRRVSEAICSATLCTRNKANWNVAENFEHAWASKSECTRLFAMDTASSGAPEEVLDRRHATDVSLIYGLQGRSAGITMCWKQASQLSQCRRAAWLAGDQEI